MLALHSTNYTHVRACIRVAINLVGLIASSKHFALVQTPAREFSATLSAATPPFFSPVAGESSDIATAIDAGTLPEGTVDEENDKICGVEGKTVIVHLSSASGGTRAACGILRAV